jgi:hypothetical protein
MSDGEDFGSPGQLHPRRPKPYSYYVDLKSDLTGGRIRATLRKGSARPDRC